nr:PREDICTED: uncharacterized protein LOC105667926 [Linepithema humile]
MSGDKYVTASLLIPITVEIQMELTRLRPTLKSSIAQGLDKSLQSVFSNRLLKYEARQESQISTFCDPRLKKLAFLSTTNAKTAQDLTEDEVKKIIHKDKNEIRLTTDSEVSEREEHIRLGQRQRAFRPTDGCSDNIFLLDLVLRYHYKRHKSLYMASLDIAKAFDSVAHKQSKKLWISTIRLCCDEWKSENIKPACGVKQDDSMSPMIFNMIIDRLLKQLPEDIGARMGELTINAAAFADDMVLCASTSVGLQRYLGIPFTPEERAMVKVTHKLQEAITRLTRAALKPQQHLFALRTMVIPGIFHQLELSNTSISLLRKCDSLVQCAVRKWLSLPTDSPNAYVHAGVRDGGLGIEAVRWSAPLRRLNRLKSLPLAQQQASGVPGSFLSNEIALCKRRLADDGAELATARDVAKRWAEQLYARVDGGGLKESSCRWPETLDHVLQKCHKTHGPRIKRHNAVTAYVIQDLRKQEYLVEIEPQIRTATELRKPDIIAKLGQTALLIDAQVVNDPIDLDSAHQRKSAIYKDIEAELRQKYAVTAVKFTSVTLSWKGIWSQVLTKELLELGVIRPGAFKVLSSRILNDAAQQPTYWTAGGSSYIDVTLSSPTMSQFIGEWKVRHNWTSSDHNSVDVRVRVPKVTGNDRGAETNRFDTRRADWDRFAENLRDLFRSQLEVLGLQSAEEVELMAQELTVVLQEACKSSMPRKRRFRKSNPWWYRELPVIKKREVRKAKLASWRKFVTWHGNSEAWSYVYKQEAEKFRVERVVNTLRQSEYSTNTVEETASYLLNVHVSNDRKNEDTDSQSKVRENAQVAPNTADAPIFTEREVVEVVKSFKNNTAPGPDLIEQVGPKTELCGHFLVAYLETFPCPNSICTLRSLMQKFARGVFAPTVAYAAAGWADLCTERDIRKLQSIQRKVLIPVVGAYRTSSRESLCVVAGATPVEILFQESRARYEIRRVRDAEIVETVVAATDKDAVKRIKAEGRRMWQARDISGRMGARWIQPDRWSAQVLTGHGDFRARLASLGLVDSGACDYGGGEDTVPHLLLECKRFEAQRVALRDMIRADSWRWPEVAPFLSQSACPGTGHVMSRPPHGPPWAVARVQGAAVGRVHQRQVGVSCSPLRVCKGVVAPVTTELLILRANPQALLDFFMPGFWGSLDSGDAVYLTTGKIVFVQFLGTVNSSEQKCELVASLDASPPEKCYRISFQKKRRLVDTAIPLINICEDQIETFQQETEIFQQEIDTAIPSINICEDQIETFQQETEIFQQEIDIHPEENHHQEQATTQARRYTLEDKMFCISIYKRSPSTYKFLSKYLFCPSSSILNKQLQQIPFDTGCNKIIIQYLKLLATEIDPQDLTCILIWDEISIQPAMHYDKKTDKIIGFEDWGRGTPHHPGPTKHRALSYGQSDWALQWMERLHQVKAMIFFASGSQKNPLLVTRDNPMQKRLPFEPLKQHFTNGFSMFHLPVVQCVWHPFSILLDFSHGF